MSPMTYEELDEALKRVDADNASLRTQLALATRTAEARGIEITECHAELAAANAERERLREALENIAAESDKSQCGTCGDNAYVARAALATPPPAPVARETTWGVDPRRHFKGCPLRRELEEPAPVAREADEPCRTDILTSRTCERGTRGCFVRHVPPIPHPTPKGPTMTDQGNYGIWCESQPGYPPAPPIPEKLGPEGTT
jgi:hypothetical protein